jgi:gas vesicle protein
MKTVTIFFLLGAVLGAAAATVIVPPTLSWYNEAGFLSQSGQASQVQALVNIPQVIRYATNRLIRGQLIGAAIGAVAFLVLGIVVASKGRGRSAHVPAPRPN